MRNPENIVKRLTDLFQRLLKEPMLKKGEKWKDDDWPGWEPNRNGVYILWRRDDDICGSDSSGFILGDLPETVVGPHYHTFWAIG